MVCTRCILAVEEILNQLSILYHEFNIGEIHLCQALNKATKITLNEQLNLSEIAFNLDYSSVAHLSSQFKKSTGLTPSHYKKIGEAKTKSLGFGINP